MTACMCLEKLSCSSFTGYHHTNVNFASLRGPRGALAVKSQDSTYFNEYSLPSPTAEQLQDSRRAQGRPDVPSYRKMRAWRFAPLLLVTTRKRTPRFHDYWPSNGKPPSTCRYIRRRLNASTARIRLRLNATECQRSAYGAVEVMGSVDGRGAPSPSRWSRELL